MARSEMNSTATYDDVNLILRLYDMRREEKLREARAWFLANFRAESVEEVMQKFPPASDEGRMIRMVVTYWEMVASFLTSGVLNQELFFQTGREMLFVWTRIRHLAPAMREAVKDPTLYRNLENACKAYTDYLSQQGPELVPAFEARVLGSPAR